MDSSPSGGSVVVPGTYWCVFGRRNLRSRHMQRNALRRLGVGVLVDLGHRLRSARLAPATSSNHVLQRQVLPRGRPATAKRMPSALPLVFKPGLGLGALEPSLRVIVRDRLARIPWIGEHEGRADAADLFAPARQRCARLLVHRDRVLMFLAVLAHAVVPRDRAERLILGLLEADGLPT